MGLRDLGEASPGIVATQSTHKQLASFTKPSRSTCATATSGASAVASSTAASTKASCSTPRPRRFYPLFASLDVGAQMMKGRSGEVLWDDTFRLGIELRKKLRPIRREFEEKERDPARRWFFDPFVPQRIEIPDAAPRARSRRAWESDVDRTHRPRPALLGAAQPSAWHGFTARAGTRDHRSGETDPADAGFRPLDRRLRRPRRAGAGSRNICARTAWCRRSNDLNSLLFLLTPGVELSKAGTLVSALVAFKRLHDDNVRSMTQRRIRRETIAALSRQAQGPVRGHARLLPRTPA